MRFPLIVTLLTVLLLGCAGYPPSKPASAQQPHETPSVTAEQPDGADGSKADREPTDREAQDRHSPGNDAATDLPSSSAESQPQRELPVTGKEDSEADSAAGRNERSAPAVPTKPMTIGQLGDSVLRDVRTPYALLVSEGRPVLLSHDVDIDGLEDVCVLVVETDTEKPDSPDTIPLSEFSDFSRLYQDDRDAYTTYLQVYRQRAGSLELVDTILLGEKIVFESFGKVMIRPGFRLPVAFSASFQTSTGQETEWAVYYTPWEYSRLTLRDELRTGYYVEDVNGDNILDVVVQERGFEEGTGYETFLTWFRWNGEAFEEHRFANVVRSIRQFLGRARDLLIQEDWRGFVEHGIAPEMLDPLAYRTESAVDIVAKAFRPATPEPAAEPVIADGVDIVQVVFPNVMEDPFTPSGDGTAFPVSTRVVTRDGRTVVLTATIVMMKNPFVGRQYTFVLHNDEVRQARPAR